MNTSNYNNTHLVLAGLFTAFQLFFVAALFDQINSTYSTIMVINSILLPLIMAFKTPRNINNLLFLFNTLFKLGMVGFLIAWLTSIALPKTLIENNPIILEGLSQLVAISVTLPPSVIPFAVSLFAVVLVSREKA